MTRPLAEVHVTVEPIPEENVLVHVTKEEDGDTALCGYDLTGTETAEDPVPDAYFCVVCVDLIHEAEDTLSE